MDLLNKREFCNVIDTENNNGKLFHGRFEINKDDKGKQKCTNHDITDRSLAEVFCRVLCSQCRTPKAKCIVCSWLVSLKIAGSQLLFVGKDPFYCIWPLPQANMSETNHMQTLTKKFGILQNTPANSICILDFLHTLSTLISQITWTLNLQSLCCVVLAMVVCCVPNHFMLWCENINSPYWSYMTLIVPIGGI